MICKIFFMKIKSKIKSHMVDFSTLKWIILVYDFNVTFCVQLQDEKLAPLVTILLLVAAGVALVIQNSLMAKITHSASTVLIALVLNSAVGLILLISLLAIKSGLLGFHELLQSFRGWALVPGILGAFFVFAGITGYQNLGASRTIAILVASQLVAGLGYDIYRSGGEGALKNMPALMGAVLLVVGAFLVASRKF
jgi:Uncharacterized protein conserved in bacteria